jgi:regulator of cell morphogenesis and NO signaling
MTAFGPESAVEEQAPHELGVRPLVELLLATHHVESHRAGSALPLLALELATAHGAHIPKLRRMHESVAALFHELSAHMEREERVLFPYFLHLVDADARRASIAPPPFETAARPIRVMRMDHEAAALLLREIAVLRDACSPVPDASGRWAALCCGLAAHEADLARHVWLEEEVLFPKALELEARVFAR